MRMIHHRSDELVPYGNSQVAFNAFSTAGAKNHIRAVPGSNWLEETATINISSDPVKTVHFGCRLPGVDRWVEMARRLQAIGMKKERCSTEAGITGRSGEAVLSGEFAVCECFRSITMIHKQKGENIMLNLHRIMKFLACLVLVISFMGCASTRTHESTGGYVDDSAITTKVKAAIFTRPGVESHADQCRDLQRGSSVKRFCRFAAERHKGAERLPAALMAS